MLERGYLIIIAGGFLVAPGIVVSAVWSGSIVGQFLQENTIIGQAEVRPSEAINVMLHINDISHPLLLALHFEPESI